MGKSDLTAYCHPDLLDALDDAAGDRSRSAVIRSALIFAVESAAVTLYPEPTDHDDRTAALSVQVDDELARALDEKADDYRVSRSRLMRWAAHYAADTGLASMDGDGQDQL